MTTEKPELPLGHEFEPVIEGNDSADFCDVRVRGEHRTTHTVGKSEHFYSQDVFLKQRRDT